MTHMKIQMLGEFTLQFENNKLSAHNNRSKKVWLLLAYLLCRRGRTVTRKELIDCLWGENSASEQPENALKITFHRLRTQLNHLWPMAGHQLVLFKDGGYCWNTEIPVTLDIADFELLCQKKTENEEEQLTAWLNALVLYRGEFLSHFSSESWIIPLATHYHNLYIQLILNTVPLLAARGRQKEIIAVCRQALPAEPYHELPHQYLMQALLDTNDRNGAKRLYKELEQRLFSDFGLKPGKELLSLYQLAAESRHEQMLPIDTVLEHLKEEKKEVASGALQQEYEAFKILCHAESRSMLRNARETHVALFSVTGNASQPLSGRSTEKAMEALGEEIRTGLRLGDSFSRCSLSQYIVLLPHANYENSCMACRRVIGAFSRKQPHSPAVIRFIVQPLTSAEHLFQKKEP